MTALAEPGQSVEETDGVPADDTAIRTHGLTKRFRGGQVAVDHLDLAVPAGSVFGFLGPNGSGKTTTIRMLLGLIAPTSGSHSLLGLAMPKHAGAVLPRVGALVEGPAFHPQLSGTDNLRRIDCADRTADPATARARIGHALERVGLTAAARKKFRAYSLGMRQRLGIAAALLQPRSLLVLDEPTNGLDPQGTREIRHLVGELAADGTTVLLSTHLLSEVEQVCTHVGVMHVGKLVANGTLAELRASTAPRVRVSTTSTADAVETLKRLGLAEVTVADGEVSASPGENAAEDILRQLVSDGVPVSGYQLTSADLEDVFVSLTGEGFDVSG
ncbi:ABC transporter ATP-binding protein [Fodinicola acaciae]|uniref:ABC transporter ATP-binding protein n=1 Tax=Fodinicola acaciae TaxID=2681555 RepID=UPI0013D86D3E|nr:ABC transporter ATP-binding protein [Fodinicola acaciae]